MNFGNRLQGVFFAPKPTFKAIAERPVWVDALIVILIVYALFSYLSAPIGYKDTLALYKDNVKLQERMGKERFDNMIKGMENPTTGMILGRNVGMGLGLLVIGFLVSSLILLIIGRMGSTEGNFVMIFAVLLHANFIDKLLGSAVKLALILTRKSVIQTTTSLALLAPNAELASPAFIVLSQFDFFQLWTYIVLGFGLAAVFKSSVKKGMIISFSFWFLKSLVVVALGFFASGLAG